MAESHDIATLEDSNTGQRIRKAVKVPPHTKKLFERIKMTHSPNVFMVKENVTQKGGAGNCCIPIKPNDPKSEISFDMGATIWAHSHFRTVRK